MIIQPQPQQQQVPAVPVPAIIPEEAEERIPVQPQEQQQRQPHLIPNQEEEEEEEEEGPQPLPVVLIQPEQQQQQQQQEQQVSSPEMMTIVKLMCRSECLHWYEWKKLVFVSRDWQHAIEASKDDLSDWNQICRLVNSQNKLHHCSLCGKPWIQTSFAAAQQDQHYHHHHQAALCACSHLYNQQQHNHDHNNNDNVDYALEQEIANRMDLLSHSSDPRLHESTFPQQSSLEQARLLLGFQQECIYNLQQGLCGGKWTEPTPFYYHGDNDVLMHVLDEMMQYNPNALYLLVNISKLLMAQESLRGDTTAGQECFRQAFLGNPTLLQEQEETEPELQGYEGFYLRLSEILEDILQMHDNYRHKYYDFEADEHGLAKHIIVAQIQHVGNSLYKTLLKRDATADALLGPRLADSINVLAAARQVLLPRLVYIFPLEWQPSFGSGGAAHYYPPATDMFVMRRRDYQQQASRKRKLAMGV